MFQTLRRLLPLLCLAAFASASVAATLTITNREIRLDGGRFIMRGMCYNPVPIGGDGRLRPHGDYFTKEFRAIYGRDLPKMREMGVNTVRVYGWMPGADHSEFLDQAWNGGHRPIRILINRWINPSTDWTSKGAVAALKTEWAAIAREVKDHPATLGYMLGNELNQAYWNRSLSALWLAINEIAGEILRHDTNHLITSALADQQLVENLRQGDRLAPNLNAWSVQVYRGNSFKGLFDDYARASNKPMFASEFGLDAWNARQGREQVENADLQADVIESLWKELERNRRIASGGAVFEWSDEWWKQGRAASHEGGGWLNGAFRDGQADEEWWGIHRLQPGNPDVLEPRAAVERLRKLWAKP